MVRAVIRLSWLTSGVFASDFQSSSSSEEQPTQNEDYRVLFREQGWCKDEQAFRIVAARYFQKDKSFKSKCKNGDGKRPSLFSHEVPFNVLRFLRGIRVGTEVENVNQYNIELKGYVKALPTEKCPYHLVCVKVKERQKTGREILTSLFLDDEYDVVEVSYACVRSLEDTDNFSKKVVPIIGQKKVLKTWFEMYECTDGYEYLIRCNLKRDGYTLQMEVSEFVWQMKDNAMSAIGDIVRSRFRLINADIQDMGPQYEQHYFLLEKHMNEYEGRVIWYNNASKLLLPSAAYELYLEMQDIWAKALKKGRNKTPAEDMVIHDAAKQLEKKIRNEIVAIADVMKPEVKELPDLIEMDSDFDESDTNSDSE